MLKGLALRAVASVRLRACRVPRFLTSLRRVSEVAMQRAEPEQPAKRPRCDGSPRTPPSTRPAATSASPYVDIRKWEPEDVCSFLKDSGFREEKVLDSFRGSWAEGPGMATEGPSGEDPRGRRPKGEARGSGAPGGSGWRREPEPEAGGSPQEPSRRLPKVGTEVRAHKKVLARGNRGASNLGGAQGSLHLLLVRGSLQELVTSSAARRDPRPSRRLCTRPRAVACGL